MMIYGPEFAPQSGIATEQVVTCWKLGARYGFCLDGSSVYDVAIRLGGKVQRHRLTARTDSALVQPRTSGLQTCAGSLIGSAAPGWPRRP